MRAEGEFEVRLEPLEAYAGPGPGAELGRLSIEKHFSGDLQGGSAGEMLTAVSAVEGSAAYVAIERFEGLLKGRRGSFVLVHMGVSTGDQRRLVLEIAPDSGTADLQGIEGAMAIEQTDGRHYYVLEYVLP
ncbi:MAG: DUF3224 domain-containing protein [Candidatus Promineifilaceae bacterium]